ncbi:DUF3489 domain-containing protein [Mesorhizobium sp. M0514]|uniref:DUF3489 domain-containing protein n=1 Tax=Mesorhizobium sp. M0514 TaxID=2956955 RepID=UPI00333DAA59
MANLITSPDTEADQGGNGTVLVPSGINREDTPRAKTRGKTLKSPDARRHAVPAPASVSDTFTGKAGVSSRSTSTTPNKSEQVLKRLRSAKGATISMLMEATGWQAHSVRGFLSGTVKKKLGLSLTSEVSKDGARRYRVADAKVGE